MTDKLNQISPVILTCARNLTYMRSFAKSFVEHVVERLPAPNVVVDITAGPILPAPYIDLVASLRPRCVTIHSKAHGLSDGDSVQHGAFFALQHALNMLNDGEQYVMFLEDDIVFSSRFLWALNDANLTQDMAFYTLYQPFNGYGDTDTISSDKIHGGFFFGTQCMVFPVKTVELLLKHQLEIERTYPPGYDLRWSRFLDHRGKVAYTARKSYVQHIGTNSRLGCMAHVSSNFVP